MYRLDNEDDGLSDTVPAAIMVQVHIRTPSKTRIDPVLLDDSGALKYLQLGCMNVIIMHSI